MGESGCQPLKRKVKIVVDKSRINQWYLGIKKWERKRNWKRWRKKKKTMKEKKRRITFYSILFLLLVFLFFFFYYFLLCIACHSFERENKTERNWERDFFYFSCDSLVGPRVGMPINPQPAGTCLAPSQLHQVFSPRLCYRVSGRVFLTETGFNRVGFLLKKPNLTRTI